MAEDIQISQIWTGISMPLIYGCLEFQRDFRFLKILSDENSMIFIYLLFFKTHDQNLIIEGMERNFPI